MNKNIGIVGATGLVGQEVLRVLADKKFPLNEVKLFASEKSAGKEVVFQNNSITVQKLSPDGFNGLDIVFFCAGEDISKEYVPHAAKAGAIVIDNTTAFRMENDVPLVVACVNPEDIKLHKGVIANPNCTTAIAMTALAPLNKEFKLIRAFASSYQAVSGWGKHAMDVLRSQSLKVLDGEKVDAEVFSHQIAFNVIPHINDFVSNGYTIEEEKMLFEGRKILHNPTMLLSHTAANVPVFRVHSISISAEFEKPINADSARKALESADGVEVVDNPAKELYPMPITATGKYNCEVGRIRKDSAFENGISLWVSGDQLLRGAASNAVEIAELLLKI